jgi:hypothetical protein
MRRSREILSPSRNVYVCRQIPDMHVYELWMQSMFAVQVIVAHELAWMVVWWFARSMQPAQLSRART